MDFLTFLIQIMQPTPIYDAIGAVAGRVFNYVTPVLLLIAVYVRTTETQLAVFSGNGKWAATIRDFMVFGFVVAVYFPLANMVVQFVNGVYSSAGGHASVGEIMRSIGQILQKLDLAQDGNGTLTDIASAIIGAFGWILFQLTMALMVFLHIFIRLAIAVLFGLTLIWGLFAIPISVSQGIKLLKGWGVTTIAVLLWPIVESIILGLLAPVFTGATDAIIAEYSTNAGTQVFSEFGVYLGLFVMCLVVCAAMVAAPFVANALGNNSSAVASVVTPFIGAALTAAAGYAKGVDKAQKAADPALKKGTGALGNAALSYGATALNDGRSFAVGLRDSVSNATAANMPAPSFAGPASLNPQANATPAGPAMPADVAQSRGFNVASNVSPAGPAMPASVATSRYSSVDWSKAGGAPTEGTPASFTKGQYDPANIWDSGSMSVAPTGGSGTADAAPLAGSDAGGANPGGGPSQAEGLQEPGAAPISNLQAAPAAGVAGTEPVTDNTNKSPPNESDSGRKRGVARAAAVALSSNTSIDSPAETNDTLNESGAAPETETAGNEQAKSRRNYFRNRGQNIKRQK